MSAEEFMTATKDDGAQATKGRKVETANPPTLQKSKAKPAGINMVVEALEKKKAAAAPYMKKLKQMNSNQ